MNCQNMVLKYQKFTFNRLFIVTCNFLPETRRLNFLLLTVFNFLKNDQLG